MVAWKLSAGCVGALALGWMLTGCTDFSQQRLDGLSRTQRDGRALQAKGPPQPAEPLYIPGPPTARSVAATEGVQQTQFIPKPERKPLPGPDETPKPSETVETPAAPQGNPLRQLHQKAVERYATMDSYIMRMRRREVVNGQKRPEELMLVKFRKQPWSVYFKWLGEEAKGREVVFVKEQHKGNIHTLTAAGDVPLLPAGQRFEVSPDSVMVRSKSRYPITEAGLEPLIVRFGKLVDAVEQGDHKQGTVRYVGKLKRPEFEGWVEAVLQTVQPGNDPLLAKGGQRWWFFDAELHLPVLVIAQDETSREVEYYCHDHIQFPVQLDDDDFNPNKLWKKSP